MSKLPVTIVSPVMNCISEMPAHADHLRLLSGMVREIIVVDSHSGDGTREYLQKALADLEIRFIDHPPGLYHSWNHAISKATQPFISMATVGDVLPAASLKRLYETIGRFSADVVVSAPTFVHMDGTPSKKRWPVHHLLDRIRGDDPFEMDAPSWIVANFGFYSASLISSSAGNLYRTALLQEHPFPTDFRHWGDIAWALKMGHLAKWVIDPGVESTFLLHPRSKSRSAADSDDFEERRASLAGACLDEHRRMLVDAGVPPEVMAALDQAAAQIREKQRIKSRYRNRPARGLPWFLNPCAIGMRRERIQVEGLMDKRRELALKFISSRLNERLEAP